MYVHKKKKKFFKETKQMKDKACIMGIMCTAADGFQFPVSIIGKAKKPVCFGLLDSRESTPLPYKDQKNARFDKDITIWWINNVFWPEHVQRNGDNCTAHKIDISKISSNITIKFLPPNVMSRHQPADMGMIAALKTGYTKSCSSASCWKYLTFLVDTNKWQFARYGKRKVRKVSNMVGTSCKFWIA